ncbi:hypothetical protein QUB68_25030 [Microcoleus sp. A006_D1]|uniref:hypothetical protein n=1 Tax=Microcoleus sp. A006_D1 TaxID=3055267 RepID=UPI002FD6DDBC
MMFQVTIEPFVVNFTQIVDIDHRPWSMGELNDWIWSIQDFNTTWGIEKTLELAIDRSKQAIAELQDDFNLTCEQVISEKNHICWNTSSEDIEF